MSHRVRTQRVSARSDQPPWRFQSGKRCRRFSSVASNGTTPWLWGQRSELRPGKASAITGTGTRRIHWPEDVPCMWSHRAPPNRPESLCPLPGEWVPAGQTPVLPSSHTLVQTAYPPRGEKQLHWRKTSDMRKLNAKPKIPLEGRELLCTREEKVKQNTIQTPREAGGACPRAHTHRAHGTKITEQVSYEMELRRY